MATSKDNIKLFLIDNTEGTSYDIMEALGISSSQTDFLLKELTEDGTLVREKKSTNGGRPVYHYKLAVSPNKTISTNATKVIAEAVPEPVGPYTVYLVRKDDQPEREWRSQRQYDFARALQPYDKFHARTFSRYGNTVTSLFISDASIETIAAKVQEKLPELTFGIATTLEEAIVIIESYTPAGFDANEFTYRSNSYFRQFAHYMPTAPVKATVTAAPVVAQTQPAEPVAPRARSIYDIMNDLADNGTLAAEEMKLALQTLAQDWLDNN